MNAASGSFNFSWIPRLTSRQCYVDRYIINSTIAFLTGLLRRDIGRSSGSNERLRGRRARPTTK